ncbi:hypothetical protein [Metabacillus litoralis]|uniref:hypothetical protein n=1 Tax=Metabacillus litoralis TaxID=152268 RepID=UPI001CFD7A3A|nr:hypothetical protein [Metabacillus litoralis]
MVILRNGIFIGLISGVILGLFLKFAQMITGKKVYTLLLNIDFLYNKPLSEMIEFILHLLISFIIGIIFVAICEIKKITNLKARFILSLLLTFPTFFLYFPLTILAIKETPNINDIYAIFLWIFAHLIYAIILPLNLNLWPFRKAS